MSKYHFNGFSGKWNVEKVINEIKETTNDSFYLCNLSDVVKKFDDWIEKIPRVKPFYAVSFGKI
jgi:diaminopimelate decarboxylase